MRVPTLVIFDVDGTLIAGEEHDWAAFDRALNHHLGFVHTAGFFHGLDDVTAESVVAAVAKQCGRECADATKAAIREMYLDGLRAAHAAHPNAFPARAGASALLQHLQQLPGCAIAIATGDWLPTISYKLSGAGLDVSRFPIATASDAPRRADIIRLAVARAGRRLEEAVYVGDGTWDLRACRELGVPFIGTGARIARLIQAGAKHTCETLEPDRFLPALGRAVSAERQGALELA